MTRRRKDPHAQALGRKGGKASWKNVPKEERSAILSRRRRAGWDRVRAEKQTSDPPA